MKKVIEALITYLVDNVEQLSRKKFSGVHKVKEKGKAVYRVHKGDVLPKFIDTFDEDGVMIWVVENCTFSKYVKFDSYTYWFTIEN